MAYDITEEMKAHTESIRKDCEFHAARAKEMMSSMDKKSIQALAVDCEDQADIADSFYQAFENKIEEERKKKREIDNTISELSREAIWWETQKKTLTRWAKRLNGRYWDIEKGRVEKDEKKELTDPRPQVS